MNRKVNAAAMSCSEFIERFSDHFDGVCDEGFIEEAEAHLASCHSCRRYREVVERAGELVRSVPPVNVPHDFFPRLQHRIYHLDDADALARSSTGSATTAATILGMAVLLTIVAWSPLMRSDQPEVELSPIVVSRPAPSLGLRLPPVSLSSAMIASPGRLDRGSRDLWKHSEQLLWEYSPLSDRYGPTGGLRQTRLD